jgi:hypothetical protein
LKEEDEMATSSTNRRSQSRRTSDLLDRARQEATMPRLFAAGVLTAGAAAYALLRDPDRRERLQQRTQNYLDRASTWWNAQKGSETPSSAAIPIS